MRSPGRVLEAVLNGRGLLLALSIAIAIATCGLAPAQRSAAPLRVAAAISLRDVLETIAADYEKDAGVKVVLSFGSSGQLLAQIRNGAPLDVFVSAAHEQVDALERDGLVAPDTRRVVAGNRLVLIVPKSAAVTLSKFEDLADARVKRVAIGDPGTVPAGQYAQQTLEKLGLIEPLKGRIVYGTNVRQVLDYVVRGEVSAGIVYSTDARGERDKVAIVASADPAWHKPIEYPAVVLKSSQQAEAADKFVRCLGRPRALDTLKQHGFTPPPPAASQPVAAEPARP
jgi:molybdate transport system substrate-binding protein